MNVLILTSRPIVSRHIGYDLRVANLCAHTPGALHLVIAPLGQPDGAEQTLSTDGLFDSVDVLDPLLGRKKQPLRHLRLTNDHFLELSSPRQFAAARDRLRAIVRHRQVSRVVVFGSNLAELAATLDHPDVILDVCDSVALTARREIEFGVDRASGRHLWKARLELRRWRATEGRLPRRFGQVTTISAPDTRELETLAGPGSNVLTVPNGVDAAFLDPLPEPSRRRGAAFWGNLAFGPNDEALRFFLNDVYRPMLRPAGVEFCIIGPNAPPWLIDFAAADPGVVLLGYVPDLRASVTRYPLMVNPMRTGSGLKNKVLEAFALGIAVVSTPLGVQALPPVQAGIHVLEAEDGRSFGHAVLDLLENAQRRLALRAAANSLVHQHYRWEVIGGTWRALFENDRSADDRSACGGMWPPRRPRNQAPPPAVVVDRGR
jgi:glycosyltransferase involved in cell wall biosynthesis